jgi:SAM-dependent methyltransferase
VGPGRFEGTAGYYRRYRPPYPEALLAYIVEVAGPTGRGRLLDLGCGTGQLAVPLSRHFRHVVAVDVEEEMVRVGASESPANVSWLVSRAEDLRIVPGSVEHVAAGNSFHWMDREALAGRIHRALPPGGAFFVVVGSSDPWSGTEPWQRAVVEVIKARLGERRRAGCGYFPVDPRLHQDYLVPAGFDLELTDYPVTLTWDFDRVLGYLYSTSYASPAVLGAQREGFEADLAVALGAVEPSGQFTQELEVGLILARAH